MKSYESLSVEARLGLLVIEIADERSLLLAVAVGNDRDKLIFLAQRGAAQSSLDKVIKDIRENNGLAIINGGHVASIAVSVLGFNPEQEKGLIKEAVDAYREQKKASDEPTLLSY